MPSVLRAIQTVSLDVYRILPYLYFHNTRSWKRSEAGGTRAFSNSALKLFLVKQKEGIGDFKLQLNYGEDQFEQKCTA